MRCASMSYPFPASTALARLAGILGDAEAALAATRSLAGGARGRATASRAVPRRRRGDPARSGRRPAPHSDRALLAERRSHEALLDRALDADPDSIPAAAGDFATVLSEEQARRARRQRVSRGSRPGQGAGRRGHARIRDRSRGARRAARPDRRHRRDAPGPCDRPRARRASPF